MKGRNFVEDWIIPAGIAVCLALLVRYFIFFNIEVTSGSMLPTIKINDRITVAKVYNKKKLKRQDVVVFNSKELDIKLIKRLIGLPGDKVEVRENGDVYVNNKKLDEPYIHNPGGKSGTFIVPKDHYFFLGDNRSDSFDSRYWKQSYISSEDIMGKAEYIIFPFKDFKKL